LADIYDDCQKKFDEDKPEFLKLLETHIDIDKLIPASFTRRFYTTTGRNRKYRLTSFIWALVIQKIFSIPTDSLLLTFLHYSQSLKNFCGFTKIPDAAKITRFKQNFLPELQTVFERLVDLTEPICQAIDPVKADMTIFDSSGIEAYVTENNPKYQNRVIRRLKNYSKTMGFDKSYDPYKAAYHSMPSHASSNPDVKQLYINGHFCYAYKFGLVTNGIGIVRHIAFYNQEFMEAHPEIVIERKSDSPDEDKSVHDARLLIPTLKEFFKTHPLIDPKTFLGDAAFDSSLIYNELLNGDVFGTRTDGSARRFSKAYIPLNKRSDLKYPDCVVNEHGFPCCPRDSTLPMKPDGVAKRSNGLARHKFVCPKSKWLRDPSSGKQYRQCFCDNPCTASNCGRMFYVYPEKNLRAYPGTLRGTSDWDNVYKTRSVVERSINHFKENLCVADRKTQNEKTIHADILLAGITQLITVILADRMRCHKYFRSLKPLVA
jgi:hypothetical protein